MQMLRAYSLACISLVSSSCAHAPALHPPARAPFARLLQIDVMTDGHSQKKPPDSELRVRQDFSLTLELTNPAYLYLCKTTKSGISERLFPVTDAQVKLAAAGQLRIPDHDGWLRLETFTSTDELCLLLSEVELSLAQQKCPKDSDVPDKGETEPTPRRVTKDEKPREKGPPPSSTRGPDVASSVKVLRLMVEGPS